MMYIKPGVKRSIVVPNKKTLSTTVLMSNLKTIGITVKEFEKLVDELR